MPVLTHAAAGSIHDRKSATAGEVKVLDQAQGIVEAIVSVTAVKDDVNDIIVPGAYARTLAARTPKGVWSHDWDTPVSKTLAAVELMPGDPSLPPKLQAMGAGGLLVRTQFNLKTQRGRDAFADVEFFGEESEWSIGYVVPPGGASVDTKTGIRMIEDLDLFEYSPVLFGANPHTVTMSVKSAIGGHGSPTSQKEWNSAFHRQALPDNVEMLRAAHAWVAADGEEEKSSYSFLHHEIDEDGTVGAANVAPCLLFVKAICEGGPIGPTNESEARGVYEHLVGHLIDAGVEDIPVLPELAGKVTAGVCAEHFTIEIAGVKSNTGHCEKQKNHEGPHGFDHREEEVGTKAAAPDTVQGPDGEDVQVTTAPNETETDQAKELTETLQEGIEAEAEEAEKAQDGEKVAPAGETKLTLDEARRAKQELIDTLTKELAEEPAPADGDGDKTETDDADAGEETPDGASPTEAGEVEAGQGDGQEEKEKAEDPEKEIVGALKQIAELAGGVAERLASAWGHEEEAKPAEGDAETDEEKAAASTETKQADPESPHVYRDGVSPGRVGSCEICGKPRNANLHDVPPVGSDADAGISTDASRVRDGNPDGISDSITEALDGDPVGPEQDMGRASDGNPQGMSTSRDMGRIRRPVPGVNAQDDIARARTGRSEGPSTNLSEVRSLDAPVEVKIEAPLAGSYEDVYSQVSTLVSANPPRKHEGSEALAWIEGTFGESVVVAVAEFRVSEDGDADLGFADIEVLGTTFYSMPYTTDEGTVTLGSPVEVEPRVVLTPKSAPVLAEREVKAIQVKVGRTLSAANADKIRASVLGLIEVLAAAGIDINEKDEGEGKEAVAEPATKGVALSPLDLMKAQQLSLKASV